MTTAGGPRNHETGKENGPAGDPPGRVGRLIDQNESFAANWMLRSVVPQRAQDGFESIVVI